jgi:hypothetical protein
MVFEDAEEGTGVSGRSRARQGWIMRSSLSPLRPLASYRRPTTPHKSPGFAHDSAHRVRHYLKPFSIRD